MHVSKKLGMDLIDFAMMLPAPPQARRSCPIEALQSARMFTLTLCLILHSSGLRTPPQHRTRLATPQDASWQDTSNPRACTQESLHDLKYFPSLTGIGLCGYLVASLLLQCRPFNITALRVRQAASWWITGYAWQCHGITGGWCYGEVANSASL